MSIENRYSDDGKVHDKERLKELQALPLNRKIQITQTRLIEWYTHWEGKCYVSFSGGKDSTVLADLTARVCKNLGYKLILWFSDTGLEYPEIKSSFHFTNITICFCNILHCFFRANKIGFFAF